MNECGTSEATTEGFLVRVNAFYVPERSSDTDEYFFFAYRVHIENVGDEPAQLLTRHWIITDGTGETQHVRGPGVVGEQPLMKPGDVFEYTSFCPLSTRVGTMHGTFQMHTDDGEMFDAEVAPFTLAVPGTLH